MGYSEFRSAKVLIANELRKKGWNIYGYSEDQSDSMTDYYCPAHWDGLATKNGYVLVVDMYSNANSGKDIKEYNRNNAQKNMSDTKKIKKLEAMTMDRGASQQEEETAKAKIELLQSKENNTTHGNYIVVGKYPEFQLFFLNSFAIKTFALLNSEYPICTTISTLVKCAAI